ncbi:hypothetical protein F511_25165 [Dorcoceras hygrometricum]|uniref:Uncharacterized protein n=1 Tax=Dorcoceras hygrometricum TaxID=472368 RepID=A0A2Z7BIH1_9LAMI|nr:hypothetical protein F511_25165 [Dorcoceras hygrometricum]
MDHTGMVSMFKSLVDKGLEWFLAASSSVYEAAVVDFFANEKVIVGTIVSSIANRKLPLSKDILPNLLGFQPRMVGKKKEMKTEFRLLHDIVAKALCAKAGSFDMVTSEKFDPMMAISAGLKVNWAQNIFNILLAMVNNPTRQSQESPNWKIGADISQENLKVIPAGESSKQTGDTASNTEVGESQIAQPLGKETKIVEKKKNMQIQKEQRTWRQKKQKQMNGDKVDSQHGPITTIPAWGDEGSPSGGEEAIVATPPEVEMHTVAGSNAYEDEDRMEFFNQTDTEGQDGHVATVDQSEHEESVENQANDTSTVADKDERL